MPVDNTMWNDDRKDWYEIIEKKVKKDAECVAVVFMKNGVIDKGNGCSILKTKNYGKLFNLCGCERFRDQPVAAVPFFTGFLVKEDVVATAGHCVNEKSVRDLRIIFGFKMAAPSTPVTELFDENIYSGIEIIDSGYKRNGSDWALVKLDRKVKNREAATLSRRKIFPWQAVHVVGHPAGLPLKYTSGAVVYDYADKTYFTANLNIYSGNSGSPVFDSETNEVIGMVVRGYNRYFQFAKNCWVSIDRLTLYRQGGVHCIRASEFINIVDAL